MRVFNSLISNYNLYPQIVKRDLFFSFRYTRILLLKTYFTFNLFYHS
nr:MAG TPA: hypothetical protein [Caudoviricetes sp.]DAO89277.1 MAG TPA: hypothetical protein [Caudoviricetes sp.]